MRCKLIYNLHIEIVHHQILFNKIRNRQWCHIISQTDIITHISNPDSANTAKIEWTFEHLSNPFCRFAWVINKVQCNLIVTSSNEHICQFETLPVAGYDQVPEDIGQHFTEVDVSSVTDELHRDAVPERFYLSSERSEQRSQWLLGRIGFVSMFEYNFRTVVRFVLILMCWLGCILNKCSVRTVS